MDAVGPGFQRGDGVEHAEAAVGVAVPVDFDVRVDAVAQGDDEADEVAHAPRRGVADGVADADAHGARVHRRGVERLDLFRLGPDGVLGDVHDRDAVLRGEANSLSRLPDHPVKVPLLGELPDRRGADEEVGLDGDADALGDVDDGTDVVLVRAPRRARRDGELLLDDLARQPLDGALHVRPGAGEADVGVVDADGVHEVQDADFLLDRRIGDGRRLQPVAQRLVVELDLFRGRPRRLLAGHVPVVDEGFGGFVHGGLRLHVTSPPPGAARPGAQRPTLRGYMYACP